MSEPAGQLRHDERRANPPVAADPADLSDPLTYPHCFRCHTDLTHCFLSACFCPRCGVTLAGMTVETLQPAPIPPLPLPVLATEPRRADDTHSLILGYANAMFRLGWRYENGQGTSRNAEEAVRCYFKAAKLGNDSALARLTTRESYGPLPPAESGTP
jgi:TPR repeat protein